MTPAILRALDAIMRGVSEAIPTLERCGAYHGPLDGEEIAREFIATPSALVLAPEIAVPERVGGVPVLQVSWSVYLAVDSVQAARRSTEALAMVDRLLRVIAASDWEGTAAGPAKSIVARAIYSGQLDGRAVTIWHLSWAQAVEALDEVSDIDLHTFRALSVEFTRPDESAPTSATEEACDACS